MRRTWQHNKGRTGRLEREKMQTPDPSFSLRSVNTNWPNELHQTIDITPTLIAWAQSKKAQFDTAFFEAQASERGALAASRGEQQWRKNGGPKKSINADHAARMVIKIDALCAGKFNAGSDGWIDRAEWNLIIDHAKTLSENE